MIPYIEVEPIAIGEMVHLQPFGLLVFTGCLVGVMLGWWHAGQIGLDRTEFRRLAIWMLCIGFLTSRWASMLFYRPTDISLNPLEWLDVGASMSSYGGFYGALVCFLIYAKIKQLPPLAYADTFIIALTAGWFFGRLGCSLTHDHPGLPSQFMLAVQFPDGPRHDLGLYEWLYTIGLNVWIWSVRHRPWPAGALTGWVCVAYAPARFLLDFLRVEDPTYLGLTLAQYASIGLLILGLGILARLELKPRAGLRARASLI